MFVELIVHTYPLQNIFLFDLPYIWNDRERVLPYILDTILCLTVTYQLRSDFVVCQTSSKHYYQEIGVIITTLLSAIFSLSAAYFFHHSSAVLISTDNEE
jgi:hypothetical protein